jgi:hypothetical protein
MLLVKLLKQLMPNQKVKRYETEIKAFGKCLNSRFFGKKRKAAFTGKKRRMCENQLFFYW